MEFRQLGKTGLRVSQLAMGTMSFGGDADKNTSQKLYGTARDAGINVFDCADVYNGGAAEEILGQCIAGERDKVVVTTKAYFPTSDDPNAKGAGRKHLTQAVEASLRRLKTDRVDIFFVHRFDEKTALEETLRALADLVQSGKVLYLGASNFAAWQAAKAIGVSQTHDWPAFDCIQPMYNLLKRQAESEILPHAATERLGVFTYGLLAGGLLTGKYLEDPSRNGRFASNNMYQTRYSDGKNKEFVAQFCAYAQAKGLLPASLAVAWVARHPAVTAPLIGARNIQQLQDSLQSLDLTLSDDEYAELSNLTPAPAPATDRSEEGSAHSYSAVLRR